MADVSMHMRTRVRFKQTNIHTRTHARFQQIHIHTRTHARFQQTHIHTHTHVPRSNKYLPYSDKHIHTYTHAHIHTCTHTHIHTCTHTHIHTHHTHSKDTADLSARAPLLDMPFPAVVLFNSSKNTTILSHFMNNNKSPEISSKLYVDFAVPFEVRDIGGGIYALVASIDTTPLLRDSLEEMRVHEKELVDALDVHDQQTGAAFAALLPVLWAVRVNRFLLPQAYGEAVAVVGGVVRNAVTEYISVKAAGHVDRLLQASTATQMLFIAGHDNLDTMEVAHDLFADGALQYVHTGACDEAVGTRTGGGCALPYTALLVSAYTSYHVSNIHGALSPAEDALLERELFLRTGLGMSAEAGVVAHYACPAHTATTATHAHAGFRQRYCSVCAPHKYYDRERSLCVVCENSPTCSENVSFVAHNCSWTRDNLCIDCDRDAHACIIAVL